MVVLPAHMPRASTRGQKENSEGPRAPPRDLSTLRAAPVLAASSSGLLLGSAHLGHPVHLPSLGAYT